jgi:hypothetical protein
VALAMLKDIKDNIYVEHIATTGSGESIERSPRVDNAIRIHATMDNNVIK